MREDFAILIMSYGRPDNVKTLNSLIKSNYTGKWFIVVGDDDPTADKYKEKFGDKCVIFKKSDYVEKSDRMGLAITKVIMFARNACFDIAENLGLKYFQQFDDDYTGFYFAFDAKMEYVPTKLVNKIQSYDKVVDNMLRFFESTPENCLAVTFAQGGDFIGGPAKQNPECRWNFGCLRKAMNSWLCSVDRRIRFVGCMNEDVNAYTSLQIKGYFMINLMQYRLQQPVTQTTGGMTAIYKQYGTHVKSFLSVMLNPSFVKVSILIGKSHRRLHHNINWARCAAKIIREEHRKV